MRRITAMDRPEMIISEDISSVVERMGGSFAPLSGQKLLITGGTGFVGGYLLETLARINDGFLEKPCHALILTRSMEAFSHRMPHIVSRSDMTVLQGDIREYDFSGVECDYVIDGAASADPRIVRSDPLGLMDTITRGTMNLLDLAERKRVKSFLFISSDF